ncbi:rhodanese-like domain-containing protein [Clostridiisalibacter paucivorans]|uniref:rhodanese-like domain-containing protein n=1 Tax=Clostridiisalibacter paucivorans TaxID=408753 RepID=UPI000479DB65|nr:rhodanese-like domain-containing protein [Clostridiisalibacter paucivorans]
MRKSTKLLSLLIALMLAVSLVGCGGATESDDTSSNEAPQEAPQETPQETPEEAEITVSPAIVDAVNSYFANMPDHIYKINQSEFVDKVKAGEDMFVLDIRQPDVYGEGHIKGAVNAPWGTAVSDSLDKLPKDKPIMVYCYTGQTAGQTVALLNMAGFDARSVNLGWNLGISKVEGVDEVTETTANDFAEVEPLEIDPDVKEAIVSYFEGLDGVKDTMFKNYKISEDSLNELVNAEDNTIEILSIRSEKDYANGHIPGAINIPWGAGMETEFSTLPMDKTIVVYCYTGQTAGQTVAGLRMLGYDAVSLNGGMGMDANAPSGWANKGYEVIQ